MDPVKNDVLLDIAVAGDLTNAKMSAPIHRSTLPFLRAAIALAQRFLGLGVAAGPRASRERALRRSLFAATALAHPSGRPSDAAKQRLSGRRSRQFYRPAEPTHQSRKVGCCALLRLVALLWRLNLTCFHIGAPKLDGGGDVIALLASLRDRR